MRSGTLSTGMVLSFREISLKELAGKCYVLEPESRRLSTSV
jgi:tRNA-binding EMAP/Myf-like protein